LDQWIQQINSRGRGQVHHLELAPKAPKNPQAPNSPAVLPVQTLPQQTGPAALVPKADGGDGPR